MRLDKYLKVSRIIKRRTVANEACAGGRVTVNDKIAKTIGTVISAFFQHLFHKLFEEEKQNPSHIEFMYP